MNSIEPINYSWNWIESIDPVELQKEMESNSRKIIRSLAHQLSAAHVPECNSNLAMKVLSLVPDQTAAGKTFDRFIKKIDKTGMFDPLNNPQKQRLYSFLADTIAQEKPFLASAIIGHSHMQDAALLLKACSFGHKEVVRALLDQGASPRSIDSKTGDTPLHRAAEWNACGVIELLLSHGALLEAKNYKEETPFHLACCKGWEDSALFLFERGASLIEKNGNGRTPIRLAFDAGMERFLKTVFKDFAHIQTLLNKQVSFCAFKQDLLNNASRLVNPALISSEANPLEVAFLLQSDPLAVKLIQRLTEKKCQAFAAGLKAKYPGQEIGILTNGMYQIRPEHLKRGGEEAVPEPPNTSLSGLLELFDRINFTNPKKRRYYDPSKLMNDGRLASIKDVRAGLATLIRCINNRVPHVGVPPESSSGFHTFYESLEKLMKHVANGIMGIKDHKERAAMLIDLGVAGLHCGMRWMSTAHEMYQVFRGVRPLSFEDRIMTCLLDYRNFILRSLMANPENPHQYNYYLSLVGEELGIVGADVLQGYGDTFAPAWISPEEVMQKFYQAYTPQAIVDRIKEFVEGLYKSFESKHLVVGWFADQREDSSQPVADFLYEFVFEKNQDGEPVDKIRHEAILFMLNHMSVLQKTGFCPEDPVEKKPLTKRQRLK